MQCPSRARQQTINERALLQKDADANMSQVMTTTLRLGILTSHRIQYNVSIFRELSKLAHVRVFYLHRQSARQQAGAGFGVAFEWDIDLDSGYNWTDLHDSEARGNVSTFFGTSAGEMGEHIARGQYDALIVTGWNLRAYWQGILAAKQKGTPVLVRGDSQLGSPRNLLWRGMKLIIFRIMLRSFDACLYVGERNREYLRHYGVVAARLFPASHSIDVQLLRDQAAQATKRRQDLRETMGANADTKIVLFVGKLIDLKRPHLLLAAAKLCQNNGVEIMVSFVGDGPLRAQLHETAAALGVHAHFAGFQNQSSIGAHYACADVLVLPSAHETWGLVVNEAMACGCPVVVSDRVGCLPDMILPLTGACFAGDQPEALAEAIASVLHLRTRDEAVMLAALAEVSDAHSPSIVATQLHRAVEAVCALPRPAQKPLRNALVILLQRALGAIEIKA